MSEDEYTIERNHSLCELARRAESEHGPLATWLTETKDYRFSIDQNGATELQQLIHAKFKKTEGPYDMPVVKKYWWRVPDFCPQIEEPVSENNR